MRAAVASSLDNKCPGLRPYLELDETRVDQPFAHRAPTPKRTRDHEPVVTPVTLRRGPDVPVPTGGIETESRHLLTLAEETRSSGRAARSLAQPSLRRRLHHRA